LTIHYTRNSDEINAHDMVLVDAGGVRVPDSLEMAVDWGWVSCILGTSRISRGRGL
jgi:hypothetical protein